MFKRLRPIVKGLSWRAFAAVDTMLVTGVVMYFKTGHINGVLALAVGIVGMELFTKTFLYAVHEYLWGDV